MLNYAETASSSTIVPLTSVPCSQPQISTTEPLPAMAELQSNPDWTISETFGEWLYQGKEGEIRIPGEIRMGCDAALAQGFHCGRALMLEHEDGDWMLLTDQEYTRLILQHLPATLPSGAIDPWKRGFIFSWCMTWYYQPFVNEQADAYGEDESEAASCGTMY